MKFTVVTPNYNGAAYLEEAARSVISQREDGADVEYIVVDGGSSDESLRIVATFGDAVDRVITEADDGPFDAINKGFAASSGDVLAWLNSDDRYAPGAFLRVAEAFDRAPDAAICYGHCPIIDADGAEIRKGITRFKELFFPFSSRFVFQTINFLSQPAAFFRRSAWEKAGPLRTDMVAAWDYDFLLRLWRHGGAVRVAPPPLAAFRWHEASISGRHFRTQFREDWEAAARDAGTFSPQSILHYGVRWGIVGAYTIMAGLRRRREGGKE
jgi:glycosyltransferase involved in cell wall biosynthesis